MIGVLLGPRCASLREVVRFVSEVTNFSAQVLLHDHTVLVSLPVDGLGGLLFQRVEFAGEPLLDLALDECGNLLLDVVGEFLLDLVHFLRLFLLGYGPQQHVWMHRHSRCLGGVGRPNLIHWHFCRGKLRRKPCAFLVADRVFQGDSKISRILGWLHLGLLFLEWFRPRSGRPEGAFREWLKLLMHW